MAHDWYHPSLPEHDPDRDCSVPDCYAYDCEDHPRCETCKASCADPAMVDGLAYCNVCDANWKLVDLMTEDESRVAAEGME